MLRAFVTGLRKQLPVNSQSGAQTSSGGATPREIRWLLTRHRENLDEREQADLDRLLLSSEEVSTLRSLLHTFLNRVRLRKSEKLRSWMEATLKSGIAELKSFVAGIERDYDAVKEALRLPWSQEITEEKVNTLKTIKRVMYAKTRLHVVRNRSGALSSQ